jgi:hypothetical protein
MPSYFFRSWEWRRYIPPKRRWPLNGLHDIISQKMGTLHDHRCENLKSCTVMYIVMSELGKYYVGFEVLTAVVMKSSLFWNITPCWLSTDFTAVMSHVIEFFTILLHSTFNICPASQAGGIFRHTYIEFFFRKVCLQNVWRILVCTASWPLLQ